MAGTICTIKSLDHLVIYCNDVQATINFYEKLGMRHESFKTNTPTASSNSETQTRHAMIFGHQKLNLHDVSSPFSPHAAVPKSGTTDVCFLAAENVDEIRERMQAQGLEILEGGGVVSRTGARSKLRSLYVRDPDENLVEISNEVES